MLLINQALARQEFPRGDPIGHYVYAGPDSQPWEIVGIVADVHQGGLSEAPIRSGSCSTISGGEAPFVLGPYFAIRTQSNPLAVLTDLRALVGQIDAEAGPFTMEQLVANRLTQPRLYAVLLVTFAAIAVVLAATGVFGVVSLP